MVFQKVYCDLLPSKHCRPHLCICWCRFLQPGSSHLLEEFADLSAVYSDCADLCITYPCLSFCQSKCISCSQCGGCRSTQPHALSHRLSAQAQQGSALIPNTLLFPDFPLYPCVLPAWRVLFIFFQVLQASGKSQLLQEVLFDCSRPRCLLPIPAGLLRPPSIRTDLFSCALYAPTRPASCLTRRLGVAGSIPWNILSKLKFQLYSHSPGSLKGSKYIVPNPWEPVAFPQENFHPGSSYSPHLDRTGFPVFHYTQLEEDVDG